MVDINGKGKLNKGILRKLQERALKYGEKKYKEGYYQGLLDAAEEVEARTKEISSKQTKWNLFLVADKLGKMAEEEK